MKAKGLVLETQRFRSLDAVAPPLSLPDVSRFGNDGVFTDVTWVQLPSGLWVMSFDGTTSRVDCSNDPSLQPATALTLETWVYPILPDYDTLFGFWMINMIYWFALGAGGTFCLYLQGIFNAVNVGSGVTTSEWQHVVATYDNTNMRIYRNRIEVWSDAQTGNITLFPGQNMYLGRMGNGNYPFAGLMVLPRIHGYALDPTTINKHFEAERRFFGV